MAYVGQIVPLPIGIGGLTGSKNLSQTTPEQLVTAQDLTFKPGTIRKEGGATKYNSTVLTGAPAILGGWDWWPTASTQRMVVVADDGKIYKDTGGGDFTVTLKSGLTVSDNYAFFTEGGLETAGRNRKLFIFTGQNAAQVLSADGATTGDLATPPADWTGANQPTFGVVHEGRMWAGGNANDPHRLYYSTAADQEDFTGVGSGTISVWPGRGEKLVGAMSFKGYLVCFKYPFGIYALDTTLPDWQVGSTVKITLLSAGLGATNANGILQIDNDILFISASGNPTLLSGVSEFGDVSTGDIGQRVELSEFIADNTNPAQYAKIRSIYYEAAKEAHFSIPQLGSTVPDARLVVDFNKKAYTAQLTEDRRTTGPQTIPRFRWSIRDTCVSMWLRKDSNNVLRPVSGDDAGFVWLMDQDARSKDGSGYEGKFRSTTMDLSYLDPKFGTIRKLGDFLELVVEPTGNWNLSVDLYWDGELEDTYQFNMGISGSTLGAFELDSDKLAEDQVINRKLRITGSGRRFSIAGSNSGVNHDFSIAAFFLHFRPGDERSGP